MNIDNFFYPMGKEYHRIILSQLTSIGFTILIRAINIITLNKREEIIGQVSASENQEEVVKDYQKSFSVKKIISKHRYKNNQIHNIITIRTRKFRPI
jgi:hypothetical protein